MRRRDSSVSRVRDRVDKLDEPMKVKKGLEGALVGESHIPMIGKYSNTELDRRLVYPWRDTSSPPDPIPSVSRLYPL